MLPEQPAFHHAVHIVQDEICVIKSPKMCPSKPQNIEILLRSSLLENDTLKAITCCSRQKLQLLKSYFYGSLESRN